VNRIKQADFVGEGMQSPVIKKLECEMEEIENEISGQPKNHVRDEHRSP